MSEANTKMIRPLVSVVVVNFNGKGVLEQCVRSVFSSSYSPLEIIIIDNGSNDGSDEEIKKEFDVILVKNKRNLGFCAGNNGGIREAKGQYILLLNYDAILDPEAITELVKEAFRSKDAGFYQPKILMLNNPRIINSTGINIHFAGFGILRGVGEEDLGQYNEEREICGVHGACIFASKNMLQDVGLFDDFFFAFNEDTDLGWRALLRGWKPRYVPSAIVYHKWGHGWGLAHSLPTKLYYAERNRLVMILSNYQHRSLILLLPILILAEVGTFAYCLARKLLQIKVKEYADIILMRHSITKRRRWIQSMRRIDDKAILNDFTYEFKHAFLAKPVKPLNLLFKLLYKMLVPHL